jgi:predicted flavoprotein YhiN
MHPESPLVDVAIIGGGPSGLMAAQIAADAGPSVHLYDAMPSIGRKFLLAGKGGLNLTHSEGADAFAERFGSRRTAIEALLNGFDPSAVRAWALSLGVETFIGSSGRVFPKDMKAAPLLRAWLHRLRHPATGPGVQFHMRQRFELRNTPRPGAGTGPRRGTGARWRQLGASGLQRCLGAAAGGTRHRCGAALARQLWF